LGLEGGTLVSNSCQRYNTWILPEAVNGRVKLNATYVLEMYFDSYLFQLPIWLFLFTYGITRTVKGVWFGEISVSKELNILSFGQVVALGLLIAPMLGVAQILNGRLAPALEPLSADLT
jgi:hypothetical protein